MVASRLAVLLIVGTPTHVAGVVAIVALNSIKRANERVFPTIEASPTAGEESG